jgi:hypothetical protein
MRKPDIIVAGDVCLDVVGVPIPEKADESSQESWRLTGETRTHFLPGGAMLLAEFIRAPRLAQAQEQAGKEAEEQIKAESLKDAVARERRHHLLQVARHAVEDEIVGPRPVSPPSRQVRLEQSRDFQQWEPWQTLTSTGQDSVEVKLESDRLFLRAVLLP